MRQRPPLQLIRKFFARANAEPVDRATLFLIGALVLVGIITFLSAALSLIAYHQTALLGRILITQIGIGVGVGGLAFFLLAHTPLRWVKASAPFVFGGAFLLGMLTFVPSLGVEINGARRWLDLGFTTFQTSELLKFAVVFAVAWALDRTRQIPWERRIPTVAGVIGLVVGLLLLQRDTSNLVVMLAAVGVMMFLAGLPWRYVLWALATVGVGFTALVFSRPYIWERIAVFLGLINDPIGAGFQVETAKIAIGSGGVWGQGIGAGLVKYSGLPQALNDSIFAIYAEETGFVGSLLVIALFVALGIRLGWIGWRLVAREPFGGLFLLGFATLLNMQAAWNIGAMAGALPLSGMTLPFFSQGGTSLLGLLAMSGIALHITRKRV
ncbi:hypothetical protein D6792_00995 [Candidatus Parcubacteria bacterium]|nr:MAG: hypothetical protein D6792_00995 [Candidatus Parcubacteria bacterium]